MPYSYRTILHYRYLERASEREKRENQQSFLMLRDPGRPRPQVAGLQEFMRRKLDWEHDATQAHAASILAHVHLRRSLEPASGSGSGSGPGSGSGSGSGPADPGVGATYTPAHIVKKRVKHGVTVYEIAWVGPPVKTKST